MKSTSVLLLPLALACTEVADDRAEYDETIGHFNANGVKIDVDDGLAVIREASTERVVLWSSAPLWTATVQAKFAGTFDVELRNMVPSSTLTATGSNDEPLLVTLVEESLPTRRRFSVTPSGDTLSLTLVPPETTNTQSYRFAVLSDIQSAVDEIQDVFVRLAEEPDVDFVLSVGDLTAQGRQKQLERLERELESLPIPFYSTMGNHELFFGSAPFQDYFGRGNFHFHYRGTAFTLVDSASATLSPLASRWLEDWLDEDRSRVHLFATHVPPIDPIGVRGGGFASQIEAHQLIATLAEGRVDAAFYGHIHSYYEFTTAGIPSYISGGGGGRPEVLDGIGRHYLLVEVGKSRVEGVRKVEVD